MAIGDLVELHVAAAGLRQLGQLGAIDGDQVVEIDGDVGIGLGVDSFAEAEEMERAGGRHGRLHEGAAHVAVGALELGDGDRCLAADAGLRHAGRPLEGAAVGIPELEVRGLQPEAAEPLEEEPEPRRARQLAVGHHGQTDVLLAGDDAGDLGLECGLVLGGRQPALLHGAAGILEAAGPQQAADHLGAERRRAGFRNCHGGPSCALLSRHVAEILTICAIELRPLISLET